MDEAISCASLLRISFVSFVLYYTISAVYNLYFSPLAKYPGPILAKISAWPNFYYARKGYRHVWIWQCHEKYGDAFRFKPDGVLFNNPRAFRTIYQEKANVKRGKFYEIWPRNTHEINTLNTVDKAIHARKRRVLNRAFSAEAIRSAEAFVIKHVNRWNELTMQCNNGEEWTEAKNMTELTDYLVFDIMGDLCFGKSFDLKEPGDNSFRHMPHTTANYMKFMYSASQSPVLRLWVWLKPRGLDATLNRATPRKVKEYFDFVEGSVSQRRKEEEALKKTSATNDQGRKDIFHYLFNATDEIGNPAYTIDELHGEANLLIVAGTDTTSATMIGFWFYILRSPRAYSALVDEIRTKFQSADDIRIGPTLASCKYLHACIQEALRCIPAAPSEFIREVLPGGLNIEGDHIPAGTNVGVPGWSIMHNQEYYKDPWKFRPERWIPEVGVTTEDVACAHIAFNPFSIGAGNCAGQRLAMQELLITIAKTLYRMDVRLMPGDALGGGSPHLGWGMRDKNTIVIRDAFIALRDGPMVQFRKRVV